MRPLFRRTLVGASLALALSTPLASAWAASSAQASSSPHHATKASASAPVKPTVASGAAAPSASGASAASAASDVAVEGNGVPGTASAWSGNEPRMSYTAFQKALAERQVDRVLMSNSFDERLEARVTLKDGSRRVVLLLSREPGDMAAIEQSGASVDVMRNFFEQPVDVSPQAARMTMIWATVGKLGDFLVQLLTFGVIMILLVWFQFKAMRWIAGIERKRVKAKDLDVTFDDIAGIDEAKRDVMEVVEFLNQKSKFNKLGAKIPRGILLVGDPGNGKTMLAKAVAKAANATFYQASGSEFVEMYVGLGAARVRAIFKKARKKKRTVIFIDEIDAVGKKRGGGDSHGEVEQTLNQLLVEMDGFDSKKHDIVVIAATNRAEVLDEALLRPGRFDRHVTVAKPTLKGRQDILNVYLAKTNHDPAIDVGLLARMTVGFSGAELANLVNESLIRAGKRDAATLEQTDLIEAREKLLLGDPRHDMGLMEHERKLTAVHEAGHTVVAIAVSRDPVEKVTITPRGMALGVTLQVPDREHHSETHQDIRHRLQVLMGGRAAEEIEIGQVTTGAASDMDRAFELAMAAVARGGMGKVLGTAGVSDLRKLSEGTRQALEQEAVAMIAEQYDEARAVLNTYKSVLIAMTALLLDRDTIDRDDVARLWFEGTGKWPVWYAPALLEAPRTVGMESDAS